MENGTYKRKKVSYYLMTLTMDLNTVTTVTQMESFLKTDANILMKVQYPTKKELYDWLRTTLVGVRYNKLNRKNKGIVKKYLIRVTGYSEVQTKRIINKYKKNTLHWEKWQKNTFPVKYIREDILLLHEADSLYGMSGNAIKHVLERENNVHGKTQYKNISEISPSHLYNLRKSSTYLAKGDVMTYTKTQSIGCKIGERRKPDPEGRPGFFRVDTVHQGDFGKTKGMYHIHLVDELTQIDFCYAVPAISQRYVTQVLDMVSEDCPYKILNFHSDNGSEFINERVANWLNKKSISQTKSRSRKHNDNALIESKNGSVIRKHFGYFYIPATEDNAIVLNYFNRTFFHRFLNFHRPCAFSTTITNHKGKEKKVYKQELYQTPFEKFLSLDTPSQYLKKGVHLKDLIAFSKEYSDTEFAKKLLKEKKLAFSLLILKKC